MNNVMFKCKKTDDNKKYEATNEALHFCEL